MFDGFSDTVPEIYNTRAYWTREVVHTHTHTHVTHDTPLCYQDDNWLILRLEHWR